MSRKQSRRPKTVKGEPTQDLKALPPLNRSVRLLPLEQMHETDFEHICVDLVEVEPSIIRADLKRIRGVAQFGVDVEGFCSQQKPVVVLSAKRYKSIIPSNLTTWSTEFLDHWKDYWKECGVKRFILAVTVELNDDALNAQIKKEAARFASLGICYEIWGLKQLTGKLRQHWPIAANYFHSASIEALCGFDPIRAAALATAGFGTIQGETAQQIAVGLTSAADAVRSRYGDAIAISLADEMLRLKEGVAQPLYRLIRRLKNDPLNWELLSPETKAKLLRAEGSLALRRRDFAQARDLYRDAMAYAPPQDRSSAALLKRFEVDAATALAEIDEPKTRQEAYIFAALLIENAQPEDAETVLDAWSPSSSDKDQDEPLRLRALARAFRRQDNDALELIKQAEAQAPRNYGVAWASGVIRYTAALSPALPFSTGEFPNPINSGLVRDDDTARELLNEAERVFDRLARTVDEENLIMDLKVWRLACLVSNPSRASDAQQLAAELTSLPLPHPGAVAWAVVGGISFKHDRVVKAYDKAIAAGIGNASQAVAAALTLASRGSERRALRMLEKARPFFVEASDLALIDYWTARLSKPADAATDPETISSRHQLAMSALLKRNDPSGMAALIEEEALDPEALFGAFNALASQRQWPSINAHRKHLLAFQTAQAVEIAALAAIEGGDPASCLSVLQNGRERFQGGHLPHRLRLIETRAHLKAGQPDLALELAESLRMSAPDESGFALEHARLRITIGDLAGAADVMRRLRHRKGLPVDELMQIAWDLRREDPKLARFLLNDVEWERLQQLIIPSAFKLALELGLDEAQKALFPKFQKAAKTKHSGIMVIETAEEAIALAKTHAARRYETEQQLQRQWLAAEIPAHAAFGGDIITFARLFHEPFETGPSLDAAGEVLGLSLLLRSGHIRDGVNENGESEHFVIPVASLRLDISAVLLGQELGILDKLSSIAETILVPQELPQTLIALEDAFAERFGPISEAVRNVIAALDEGRLAILDPVQSVEEIPEPRILITQTEKSQKVQDIRLTDLLHSLVTHAGLDAAAAANALRALNLSPSETETTAPLISGSRFFLILRDVIALSEVGILERLQRFVNLCVDRAEVKALRQELAKNEAGQRHRTFLSVLRHSIADRLSTGAWRFLPEAALDPELYAVVRSSAVLSSLASLVKAPSDPKAVVWVEDRTLSIFDSIEETPIIDVIWILNRLRDAGALNVLEHEALHWRLSQAGYGFRLPKADDIANELKSAPLRNNKTVETEHLSLYRADYAIQLANSRHVTDKPLGGSPAQGPEIRFVAKLTSFANEVLRHLWSDPALSAERKQAASQWVWRNLRTEQTSFLPLNASSENAKRHLVFFCFSSLVTSVFSITGEDGDQALAHRGEYLEWVFSAIIDPLVRVEPEFIDGLVNHTAHYFAKLLEPDERRPDLSPELIASVVAPLLDIFPKQWRERIQSHDLLRDRFQVRTVERVTIGADLEFESEDFLNAVENMLATGQGTAPVVNSDAFATFQPMPVDQANGGLSARFTVAIGERIAHLEDATILLAHSDPNVRKNALTQHPDWFDQFGDALESTVNAIVSLPNLSERIAALRSAQQNSMPWRLAKLAGQIRNDRKSDRDLLAPPPPDVVRAYLRLPSFPPCVVSDNKAASLVTAFANAAERLITEVGAFEALRRIAGVPVELPTTFTEAIALAVAEDEADLDEVLGKTGETPLIFTVFACALSTKTNVAIKSSSSILGRLAEVYARQGALFVSLLRWTFRAAGRDPAWSAIAEPERSALLWCHANSVMTVLVDENVTPPSATDFLDRFDKDELTETFSRNRRQFSLSSSFLDPAGHLTLSNLTAAAVVHVLGVGTPDRLAFLSESEREAVLSMVAFRMGERWAPHIDLLAPSGCDHKTGIWLDVDAGGELQRLGVVDLPEPLSERDHDAVVRLLLEQIELRAESAREGQGVWPFLWLMDPSRVTPDLLARLKSIQTSEGLREAFAAGGKLLIRALTFRAHIFALVKDNKGFLDLLTESAKDAALRSGRTAIVDYDLASGDPTTERFAVLMEVIWVFASRFADDLKACIAVMAEAIDRVATEWAGSLFGCLALLDTLVRRVPAAAAAPAWDVINRLRARQP